jgi:membrane protease YdiL (CAAX protease family)
LVLAVVPIVGFLIAGSYGAMAIGVAGQPATLGLAAGVVAIYVGYVWIVEQRTVGELRGPGAIRELGRGLGIGAVLFTATTLVLWVLGAADITGAGDAGSVLRELAGAISAAVIEELLFRAVVFRILERSLGTWIALAVSAVLFGAVHAFNPGATMVSTVAIMLEAGVLLAAAFILTRRMWLAFGLHAGWNFTGAGVFGAAVSGTRADGVLATQFHGEPLITGGAFGPEASIIALAICLTAGIALLVAGHRHGNFVVPFWRRDPRLRQA